MKQCSYCGRHWKEENGCCFYCGAPNRLNGIAKYDPFYHDGYIVYSIRDWSRHTYVFIFYKGITYIGKVCLTFEEVNKLPPADDYMPYVMDKLHAHPA